MYPRKNSHVAKIILKDAPPCGRGASLFVDSLNDICVLKLGKFEESSASEYPAIKYYSGIYRLSPGVNYEQYYFDEKNIVKRDNLFLVEDVIVVGFPGSIGLKQSPQFDYEKPLLKRGAIASISNNFNTFIIDCPVYFGNSGGPVFLISGARY